MGLSFFRFVLTAWILSLASGARAQTLEVLHSFNGNDGAYPYGGLIQATDGNFYGSAEAVVYKITPEGIFSVLATTSGQIEQNLLEVSDGKFYGATLNGGSIHQGTIFSVTTNGTLTNLVTFTGENGSYPSALIEASDGSFYGTTQFGGQIAMNLGTIFKMTTNGILTTLVSFAGTNGAWPTGPLVDGHDGFFYGTTAQGGETYGSNEDVGTIFKVTPDGILTTMYSFPLNGGNYPWGNLIEGKDGRFYGITEEGGVKGWGTIFSISRTGDFSHLGSFDLLNGAFPKNGLILAKDGNFYGTTSQGGCVEAGNLFKLTPDGLLTNLFSFNFTNGFDPRGRLIEGNDGNLYGTTLEGGEHGYGTIFRVVLPFTLQSHLNGDELVLSWPTNHVGLILQYSTDFNSTTNWVDSPTMPSVIGDQFTVTKSLSASAHFYRLKKP